MEEEVTNLEVLTLLLLILNSVLIAIFHDKIGIPWYVRVLLVPLTILGFSEAAIFALKIGKKIPPY